MSLSHSNNREMNSLLNKQGNASVKLQGLAENSIHKCFGSKAIKKRKLSYISNQQSTVKICSIFLKLSKVIRKIHLTHPGLNLFAMLVYEHTKQKKKFTCCLASSSYMNYYIKTTYRRK